jgi:hypothetical protein
MALRRRQDGISEVCRGGGLGTAVSGKLGGMHLYYCLDWNGGI